MSACAPGYMRASRSDVAPEAALARVPTFLLQPHPQRIELSLPQARLEP